MGEPVKTLGSSGSTKTSKSGQKHKMQARSARKSGSSKRCHRCCHSCQPRATRKTIQVSELANGFLYARHTQPEACDSWGLGGGETCMSAIQRSSGHAGGCIRMHTT